MSKHNLVAYKVKSNEFEFSFTQQQVDEIDLMETSPGVFSLIKNHKCINACLFKEDKSRKVQTIEIEGKKFEVRIKDELDMVLDKLGFSTVAGRHIKEIKAPMPGLVLEIAVTEGQQVHEGDKILILVAMKMENSIMIHADATIKRILVKAGQAVEKGQLLVELT